MARKTLLTESELRRFMKLADMRPVGEKRMNEMYAEEAPVDLEEDEREEEDKDDEIHDLRGDLDAADAALDAPMDEPVAEPLDAPLDDLGAEGTLAKTKGRGRVAYVKEEEVSSEDDIVAEVARRVAARLQRENHQAEVVDQLAERIMKRLTK